MRVLHIGKFFPPHWGGIEAHLETLANSLQRFVELDLLVSNDQRATEKSVLDGIRLIRAGTLFRFASAPICPAMFSAMRTIQTDLVHVHLPNPGAVLLYLASGHKGPLLVSYHADTLRHKYLAGAFKPFLLRFLDRCAAIIVSSGRYADSSDILQRYRDKIHVIPYGIPPQAFDLVDRAQVQRIRERHGNRIVLTIGRLVYYKGQKHLIRAMNDVRGTLLIAGHGPLRRELEQEIANCGLTGRVTLLGPVEDVLPYYHSSDVFVLPSVRRTEAFGIVQLEAMACGKPVINTELPSGVPGVSLNGITGLTVPPEDPAALAGAINLLLDEHDLRRKYGEAARQRVEETFTADGMTRQVLDLYSQVTGIPVNVSRAMRVSSAGSSPS